MNGNWDRLKFRGKAIPNFLMITIGKWHCGRMEQLAFI